jgi:hypothetical protein
MRSMAAALRSRSFRLGLFRRRPGYPSLEHWLWLFSGRFLATSQQGCETDCCEQSNQTEAAHHGSPRPLRSIKYFAPIAGRQSPLHDGTGTVSQETHGAVAEAEIRPAGVQTPVVELIALVPQIAGA